MTAPGNYTITKFSLHNYGTERHGSWMIPDGNGYKEILSPYKEELAAKGRAFRRYLAKKKTDEALKKAEAEAKISVEMGYKTKDIEQALVNRYGLTKEVVYGIVAAYNTPPTEDTNNGTTQG